MTAISTAGDTQICDALWRHQIAGHGSDGRAERIGIRFPKPAPDPADRVSFTTWRLRQTAGPGVR